MLTSSQINEYHENGYTTLPNLLNFEQTKSFISQIEQIIKGNSLENHDASKMEMEQDQEPEGKLVRRLYEPCTFYEIFRKIGLPNIPQDLLLKIFKLNISIRNEILKESQLTNNEVSEILVKLLKYEISLINSNN